MAIDIQRFDPAVDYYTSRMHDRYGPILRRVFARFFGPVRVDPGEVARVKELALRGTVIYVMRTRSTLDWLCSNWVYLREGLPLAQFANGINATLWQPVGAALRTTVAKLAYLVRGKRLPDPRKSGYLERLCREGTSSLAFLSRPENFLERWWRPLWDPIQALVEIQGRVDRPIYLVPQTLFYQRRPGTLARTLWDVVFGPALDPGPLRKLVGFLRGYKRASIHLAEPIDLAKFIQEHAGEESARQGRLVRLSLRNYLYREFRVTAGPVRKPRERTKEKVLQLLRADLDEIARRDGRPVEEIRGRAEAMLDEIASDASPRWIEFLNAVITWVWGTLFRAVHIQRSDMERVRAHLKRAPLVLISSHKSHLDYLLISHVFYDNDITPPHIAAGINLSFWPLGAIFRKAGAFFIRRTFAGSRLYPEVFKKYLRYMLREGYSIEFFIEGGRSRTGKLRPPKHGLLQMIAELFVEGGLDNLYLVPIAINYDTVPEDRSHAAETAGGAKVAEDVSQLLGVARVLTQRYGRVDLRVGEILSLSDYVRRHLPAGDHSRSGPGWRRFVGDLSLRVAHRINEVTPVTSTAVAASVLLAAGGRVLPFQEIADGARRILDAVVHAKAPIADILRKPETGLREGLRFLARFGLVHAERNGEGESYSVAAAQSLTIAYYRNTLLHYLRGSVELAQALACLGGGEHLRPSVYQAFERLDRLFAGEFIEPPEDSPHRRFDEAIRYFEHLGALVDRPGGRIEVVRQRRDLVVAFAALAGDLFESYRFVAEKLFSPGSPDPPRKDAVRWLLGSARQALLARGLARPESISKPFFENAVRAFGGMSPIDREGVCPLLEPARPF